MSVPGIVQSTLDGEEIAARVSLGGEDELFITPSSTIIYRAEGLLSDESIEEFAHDADTLTLSEGRRKTRFSLEYPLEGTREFTIPSRKTEAVLHPVLAGILNGNGVTDPGETVVQTYRFSELTLIITSDRLVKHIGGAVWDGDYEQYHFADVTDLSFEDGSVATQIVLEVDGRPQRIKAPNEAADDVSERLKRALCSYHDVDSIEELAAAADSEDSADDTAGESTVDFGNGVDPLDADPPDPDDAERTTSAGEVSERTVADDPGAGTDPLAAGGTGAGDADGDADTTAADLSDAGGSVDEDGTDAAEGTFEESGFEPAEPTADPEVLDRLEALETAVDRQNQLLEQQRQTIETLIEELRQGR